MKKSKIIIWSICSRFLQTVLTGLLLTGSLNAQPRQGGPRAPEIKSPEITADNKVIFRLYSNEATSVKVSGSFLSAAAGQLLEKNDTGLWTLTVGPLKPELYNYYFTVNGVRTLDPLNPLTIREGYNFFNVLFVPGEESDLYAIKDITHGTLSKVWYDSPTLGLYRRMYVYTPPGYEDNTGKYPVLYLLHGGSGDEDTWTSMSRLSYIMDNLIADGKAKPMIVVMPNGSSNQTAAITDRPPVPVEDGVWTMASEKYPNSLVKDVIPYIEKHYRVVANKENRAIAGLSLGALQTQITSINNVGMFDYMGVFSIGIQPELGDVTTELIKAYDSNLPKLTQTGYKLFYVGVGKNDFVYKGVELLRNKLDEHHFRYTYRESEGGHTWTNWRLYLSEFAPQLFK
jgi:enterochelin esterase-like enzyme